MPAGLKMAVPIFVCSLILAACGSTAPVATTTTTSTTTTIAKLSLGSYIDDPIINVLNEVISSGLKVATENKHCSNTTAAGYVLSQYPEPGTKLSRGQSVEFVVSSGSCAPPCSYVFENSVGSTLCSSSPSLTDPNTLDQVLTTTADQLMGMNPPTSQYAQFVAQFDSLQIAQERAGALDKPWYEPDPSSEATAFINKYDYDAVLAARAGAFGNDLNCMINPGAPGCG
jgi:hypothetical protein